MTELQDSKDGVAPRDISEWPRPVVSRPFIVEVDVNPSPEYSYELVKSIGIADIESRILETLNPEGLGNGVGRSHVVERTMRLVQFRSLPSTIPMQSGTPLTLSERIDTLKGFKLRPADMYELIAFFRQNPNLKPVGYEKFVSFFQPALRRFPIMAMGTTFEHYETILGEDCRMPLCPYMRGGKPGELALA